VNIFFSKKNEVCLFAYHLEMAFAYLWWYGYHWSKIRLVWTTITISIGRVRQKISAEQMYESGDKGGILKTLNRSKY